MFSIIPMKNSFIKRKFVTYVLMLALAVTQVLPVQVAYAFDFGSFVSDAVGGDIAFAEGFSSQTTVYDLVAIVVDTKLASNSTSYSGLQSQYSSLNADTFSDRVLRYAEDITAHYPLTDTKILYFDSSNDTVNDLSVALENLYINGDETRNNRLAGVVLVGDIPLPIVNDGETAFTSLLPYTDFENKAYLYNSQSKTFERNSKNKFTIPEIWHGVMRAPENTEIGRDKLAAFFDKNHLYYLGEPDFADFDKKLFFGDFVNEEKQVNPDVYSYYLQYLNSLEDLAFKRYNKHWANELQGKLGQDLSGFDPPSDEAKDFLNNIDSGSSLAGVPDIYTKTIIDQSLLSYYQLLTKYISEINGRAENTGRYDSGDVDNPATLITIKDEFAKEYLKEVNIAIEKNVNALVEEISEPLPLLTFSVLTGNFGNGRAFTVTGSSDTIASNQQVFRFHYLNEESGKFYVNGVASDVLSSAKQCSVYLGSTKAEYFDENSAFNPKAVGGEYSILTRSMRTDDFSTYMPLQTTGVNTRLLSPVEAKKLTGVESAGALIEDNSEYGIEAFSANPLQARYKNALDGKLKKGDLIVKVNDKTLGADLNFDTAISNVYRDVQSVIQSVNGKKLDDIKDFPYEIVVKSGEKLSDGKITAVVANVGLEFYRNGTLNRTNFSFTVNADGLATNSDPGGDPEIMILFSKIGFPLNVALLDYYDFNTKSDGAIFTLYDSREEGAKNGYANSGYDNSAGCSANFAGGNDDKCLAMLASMPVLDPAGSAQLPFGYDVDELYYNDCYAGLPSKLSLATDSNPFTFPLAPPVSLVGLINNLPDLGSNLSFDEILDLMYYDTNDVYGLFLKAVGRFISADDGSDPSGLLADLNELDAGDIFVNKWMGVDVSLKEFSDRYGLFDGIDNDGDNIKDYEMRAGVKWYDFDEANPKYGIDSKNLSEIGRKLLSKDRSFTLIKELKGYSNSEFTENFEFNDDITLIVKPHSYNGKEISSVIVHNEPTDYTIAQQIKAKSTASLPIDNPRYVAFQSSADQTEKIIYPNSFESPNLAQLEADMATLANNIALMPGSYRVFGANSTPAEHSVLDIRNEILNKRLAPVLRSQLDVFADDGELISASTSKLNDSIEWLNLDIDSKHEYVLRKYLSSTEKAYVADGGGGYEAAYLVFGAEGVGTEGVSGDLSLEPAVSAADYFDFNFNKDLAEESDERFDPLAIIVNNAAANELAEADATLGSNDVVLESTAASKSAVSPEFSVPLDEFYSEVTRFIDELENLANADQKTYDLSAGSDIFVSEIAGMSDSEVADIEIVAESHVLFANGESRTNVDIVLKDAAGEIVEGGFYTVIAEVDGDASIDGAAEFLTYDGKVSVDLIAGNSVSTVKLKVSLKDDLAEFDFAEKTDPLSKTATFKVIDNVDLSIDSNMKVELLQNNQRLASYNGEIILKIQDPSFAYFVNSSGQKISEFKSNMVNGLLNSDKVNFVLTNKAGALEVLIELPGFITKIGKINIPAAAPYKIELVSPDNSKLEARILDKYGNIVNTENSRVVNFEASQATASSVQFTGSKSAIALNGIASTTIKIPDYSGQINLIAKSSGLEEGLLSIKSTKRIYSSDLENFAPRSLYVSLLGSAFGDVSVDNNLAQTLLFNGQTQAVSAMTKNAGDLYSGYGFEGENKHMLFFSAGNSVGESNIPYSDEAFIIFGDPMIRLEAGGVIGLVSGLSGFTKDISKPIFSSKDEIKELIKFDYNADGVDDILLIYEDGLVRLLENELSNKRFRDRSYLLNAANGILSATRIDINNDSYDDLIVGTKESCKVDEVCISLFTNNQGHFVRSTLDLAVSDKVYSMKAADLNLDGCEDLALSDISGNFRTFYNKKDGSKCSGLEKNYKNSWNFGVANFDIGKGFNNYPNFEDEYPDFFIKPLDNSGNLLSYVHSSDDVDAAGYTIYKKWEIPKTTQSDSGSNDGDPVSADNLVAPDFETVSQLLDSQNKDSDYDGLPDTWDSDGASASSGGGSLYDMAESVADSIKSATDLLRCSGAGCLPNPYNKAFFAPDGATPGLAAFAIIPSFPFVAFAYPSSAPSTFRLYISPTATLGLGTAVCIGPSIGHQSPCFAYALPASLNPFTAVCDAILGPVNDAIASVQDSLADPDIGMATVVSDGENSTGTDAINENFGISDPDLPFSAAGAVNVRIPGFPSVITNWLDNQTDEIYNKLLDLPDFYFIYPDVGSLISDHAAASKNFTKVSGGIQSAHDFLNAINSMPLVQIEGREILVRVPAISEAQLVKWQRQADLWIKYEEAELKKIKDFWLCDTSNERKTICDSVTLKMTDMIKTVTQLMDKVDALANIPRDILTWRSLESKYATQIVNYLDAIMDYTGGYIKRQENIISAWMKTVEDAIRIFRDWKIILDLSVDYQASCDQCTTDRFSKLGLLMNFFASIPDPPIIPIPKLPDVVFDMSQVKAGVKIVWPDLVFKPEAIILPDLPTVTLPLTLDINIPIEIDGFTAPDWIMDFPSFVFPDLPDLPPLVLPKLPDLPKPARLPPFPSLIAEIVSDLKPIFKILCLLKNGLVPVPEWGLATEIETLTQPSVQATLPFVMDLGVQMPSIQYDYVEQIKINAKFDFGFSTDYIYNTVKSAVDDLNETSQNFVEDVNGSISNPLETALKPIQTTIDKVENVGGSIPDPLGQVLEGERQASLELTDVLDEYISEISDQKYQETYYLTAGQTILDPDSPILNRSLDEIEIENYIADGFEEGNLGELRNELLAYAKGLNDSNLLVSEINNYEEFYRVLVENDGDLRKIASLSNDSFVDSQSSETIQSSFLGSEVDQKLIDAGRLIAANVGDLAPVNSPDASTNNSSSANIPKGFYIAVSGVSENVLNYTDELNKKTNTLFSDVDGDEDHDLIFSIGGDLYLKENYKNNPDYDIGKVISSPFTNSVQNYMNNGVGTVQGVSSSYESHKKADIQWISQEGAESYEILIKNSINDSDDDSIAKYSAPSDSNIFSVEIENANYYPVVYAIFADGSKSLPSYPGLISPQSCSDKDAPFPSLGKDRFDLSIFQTLEIDASNSFDSSGEVVEFYLESVDSGEILWSDKNASIDENKDGFTVNDKSNPIFRVGPFENKEDLGAHEYVLHVVDQSGNSSAQKITVNVFVPNISLDESLSKSSVASGSVLPQLYQIPISLMRKHFVYRSVDGELVLVPRIEKVVTGSIGVKNKYYSSEDGKYLISDLKTDNVIVVEDSNGDTIAEINPQTGNLIFLDDAYELRVLAANPPLSPGAMQIVDGAGNIIISIYIVANQNSDVDIVEADQVNENGVNVMDINYADQFILKKIPADSFSYPGSVALVNKSTERTLAIVDTAANVIFLDQGMSLYKKTNAGDGGVGDAVFIELLYENKVAAEMYVSLNTNAEIVSGKNVPYASPRLPNAADYYGGEPASHKADFIDVDKNSPIYDLLSSLHEKQIIMGKETDSGLVFNGQELVDRAEFVKTLLDMLCIVPRPEAYLPYSPSEAGGGFYDIPYNADSLEWYYPYVKEAALLGLIDGYRGEVDAATGLVPFKPANTITRAEATKIILEALQYKGILDLSELSIGIPWYSTFMDAAVNLTPYMNEGVVLQNNFIVNLLEAQSPELEMTRWDLATMAYRVLEAYSCFEVDSDGDGMSDFCEARYGIDDPMADADSDELTNVDECFYGSDPLDEDSDNGGVFDGEELKTGGDPLNSKDDLTIGLYEKVNEDGIEYKDGESGIYIVPGECNSCPCDINIFNSADIAPGDTFFTVISSYDDKYIFSKSNDVIIESITK